MTKYQLINYCNDRIEGLHHQFRASDRELDRVFYEGKSSAYRDVVLRLGGTPRVVSNEARTEG